MAIALSKEVVEAIKDPQSIKVIASKDRHGEVHVVAKGSLSVTEDGQLFFLELLEGSQNNKNLTYSLWFDQKVAVNIITADRRSYLIKGIPRKSLVSGSGFEAYYRSVVEKNPDNDLAAVYFIEPLEEHEESYPVRREEHGRRHPLYLHLDRLAKQE
jgi:hypothetical protein